MGVWKSKSEDKEEDDVAICYLPSSLIFIGFVYKVAGSQSLIADLQAHQYKFLQTHLLFTSLSSCSATRRATTRCNLDLI